MSAALPVLNALWVEGRLGWLERACLSSAVAMGHRVTLWTYRGVVGVPVGVDLADAREVMPENQLVKHRARNSWSLGADLFRYRLMEQSRGVWIDADVYLLRPLPMLRDDLIVGWQKPGLLNNAVLYIAPDSPLLPALRDWIGQKHIVPPWLPFRKRWVYAIRPMLGLRPLTLGEHRWGVAGPRAVTLCAERLGLLDRAQPQEVFYPLQPKRAKAAFDPTFDVMSLVTPRTIGVHLWNEEVKALKASPPPRGSFVDRICREQGVGAEA